MILEATDINKRVLKVEGQRCYSSNGLTTRSFTGYSAVFSICDVRDYTVHRLNEREP